MSIEEKLNEIERDWESDVGGPGHEDVTRLVKALRVAIERLRRIDAHKSGRFNSRKALSKIEQIICKEITK